MSNPASSDHSDGNAMIFSAQEETTLRESLRRCPAPAVEAAVAYRKTGDPKLLPVIIVGIFERFVDADLRPKLAGPDCDDMRVIEDLGLDSLTMMEIVMLVEEVAKTQIANDELRNLSTIGEIKTFVDCRARGVPPPPMATSYARDAVLARMPIQPPFLFLDEARISATKATAGYRITGQEFFLQGHFKGNPVMPASIMLEALGQLGVFYLLTGLPVETGRVVGPATIFFASTDGVRCHRVCKPGDVLTLALKPKRVKAPLATFEGSIHVGAEKAVVVEELTLTFGVVDATPAS
ncbi:MAG TPA: phosphopantetheine-binding protein [Rariglobus sp.]|jgi:3-hydroxyacyl-[acyl-carrier-protein] dehydratase|nr:phosphopantetheine-binding protein [Rariglobus sp.]